MAAPLYRVMVVTPANDTTVPATLATPRRLFTSTISILQSGQDGRHPSASGTTNRLKLTDMHLARVRSGLLSPEDDGDDERHRGDGVHHGSDERWGRVLQAREVHVQS
jgi:hypothetical protein